MKPHSSIFNFLILLFSLASVAVGYNNGLARTPQMGWNTWNRFGCDIDEELIVESAKVVAEKLKVYGYECTRTSPAWVAPFVDLSMCRYRDG
jgi:alpha-galactosidase